MKKYEVIDFLKESKILFEITEHEAVFTIDELMAGHLPYPEAVAKNLFLRDEKKRIIT